MSIGHLFDLVDYGTNKRFDCPMCRGINTLSITKEQGKVKYNCFKNSCELHRGGSRVVNMTQGELRDKLMSKTSLEGRTAAKEAFRLPDYWIRGFGSKKAFQMLLNANALESYELGFFNLAYDPKQDRMVYLVRDENKRVVGAVGRALGTVKPKVINYPGSAKIPFTCGKGSNVVLVEDCASACSIGRFKEFTGLAMLGTNLKPEYLFYAIMNYSSIVIALDPDAYAKSFKLQENI